MIIVHHRVNTVRQLLCVDTAHGCEIDLRTFNGSLVLSHDILTPGELFSSWIRRYSHKLLILNIKEEGIEDLLLPYLPFLQRINYFLLDQSFPYLKKHTEYLISALRVSNLESPPPHNTLVTGAHWYWLDNFASTPHTPDFIYSLSNQNKKTCLVSPELHGYPVSFTQDTIKYYSSHNIQFHAVCTKFPNLWASYSH